MTGSIDERLLSANVFGQFGEFLQLVRRKLHLDGPCLRLRLSRFGLEVLLIHFLLDIVGSQPEAIEKIRETVVRSNSRRRRRDQKEGERRGQSFPACIVSDYRQGKDAPSDLLSGAPKVLSVL